MVHLARQETKDSKESLVKKGHPVLKVELANKALLDLLVLKVTRYVVSLNQTLLILIVTININTLQ